MTTAALIQQLEPIFQQQIDAAVELKQILMNENEALIQRAHEQIQELTQLKEEKSAHIESLSEELRGILASAGLTLSQQALDDIIATAPGEAAEELKQRRRELEAALQACQEQNIINGQLIAANHQSAEAALAILRGQFSPGNLTYGASGQPVSEQTSSQISKA